MLGFSEEEAIKEANRCLNCNCCSSSDQIFEDFEKAIDSSGVMISQYGDQANMSSLNAIDYLEIPRSVIGILNQNDIEPVALADEKCCGHDALWRGDLNIKVISLSSKSSFLVFFESAFSVSETCISSFNIVSGFTLFNSSSTSFSLTFKS